MRQIYTIEISALINELRDFIGYYIDKFYELDKAKFRFRISKRNSKIDLLCILSQRLSATNYIESVLTPTNFAVAVRKRITGFKIDSIDQINDDRIISLGLSKGEEKIFIIIEMFSKGNFILTDKEFKITLAYIRHKFRDRTIMHGEIYKHPKNSNIKISNLDDIKHLLIPFLNESDKSDSVIKILTHLTNIGSMYIEDILNRSDINPRLPIIDLNPQMIEKISKGISTLNEIILSPKPRVYIQEKEVIDYSICGIKKYAETEKKDFDTIQGMLEYFYHNATPTSLTRDNPKAKELEISIRKQKVILKEMLDNIGSNKIIGESIFNRMYIINRLIDAANDDRHMSVEKLSKLFPEIKIYNIDLKKKTIEIEI